MENDSIPKYIVGPTRITDEQEDKNEVDDGKSFVVMGAITECDQGESKKPFLRTTDIGTLDGYGIKMLNVNTDKIKNWTDEGIQLNLSGEKAGKLKDETLSEEDAKETIKPTIWYENCKMGGKCKPNFLDEWFEPSETVGYKNNNLAVNEYQKALKELKSGVESLQNKYNRYVNDIKGEFFGIRSIFERPRIERQQEINQKNITAIDPKISSSVDAKNDFDACKDVFSTINLDEAFLGANLQEIQKVGGLLVDTEAKLTALTSDKTGTKFPLIKRSVLICKKGGVVRITDDGQILSFSEYAPISSWKY